MTSLSVFLSLNESQDQVFPQIRQKLHSAALFLALGIRQEVFGDIDEYYLPNKSGDLQEVP